MAPIDNKNINSNDLEGNVDINDLKQLITSLGKSQSDNTKGSLTSFPKPSCGRNLSEDSDEESSSKEVQEKIPLKKKTSKNNKIKKLKKLINKTAHSIPSPSSASKESHFYGIPNFVNDLTSYESVKKSIKEILGKLTKKVKRSPSKQTNCLTQASEDKNYQIVKCENDKEEVKSLKRKLTHDSTLAEPNQGKPKIQKLDIQGTNFFTKLQNEDIKPKSDNDSKVFGPSLNCSLNPYRSVSLTVCTNKEKTLENTYKSKSEPVIKHYKESSSFPNSSDFVENFKRKSTKTISASNSKSSINPNEEILATTSNKADKNVAEKSDPKLKLEKNRNQKTVCKRF